MMTSSYSRKDILRNYHLLDFLRGSAAISVVLYHHQHFYRLTAGYDSKFDKESQPFYDQLSYFYNNGSIAVELFWTISGFVLGLNYLRNTKSRTSFFRNRFARLYPLHVVTLVLVAIFQTVSKLYLGHFQIYPTNDFYHFILNLFGVPFVGLEKDYSFNGPIWSVSVELLAYLILGIFLNRFRNSKSLPFIFLTISIIIFRYQPLNIGHSIYELFVFFFFGVTLFRVYEASTLLLRMILGPILILGFALLKVFGKLSIAGFNHDGAISTNRLNFLLLFGGLIVLLCTIQELNKAFIESVNPVTDWVGNLTYATYLLHVPLQILILMGLQLLKLDQVSIVSTKAFLIIYLLALVVLSRLSYTKIEKPLRRKLRTSFS